MAGGGTFIAGVEKDRPGLYVNVKSTKTPAISAGGTRGTALLPLKNTNYGAAGQFITLTSDAMDAARNVIGYSVSDDDTANNMVLIREMFKKASTVIVYICTNGITAATATGGGLTAVAKYKGARGNDMSYSIVANPLGGFDIRVYLDSSCVEQFERCTTVDELTSAYITFAYSDEEAGTLEPVAGVRLNGGESGETSNGDVTAYLDATSRVNFDTMAFPFDDEALKAACVAKIKSLRNAGKTVQAVVANYDADYEGVINVTNGYTLSDRTITATMATAYIAGATAGASNVESNTNRAVPNAVEVFEPKLDDSAASQGIRNGELFFTVNSDGDVCIEYDINSLTTITQGKDKSYRKNRVIRVLDTFLNALKENFPPNRFDNDPDGWKVMAGIGKGLLKQFGPKSEGGVGAIKNIDYDNDFVIDESKSEGDQTFITVGLEPVDSAEKIYITACTR